MLTPANDQSPCECGFCNAETAILTIEDGTELHLHPILFSDPRLGEGGLYVGMMAAIAGLAHEIGASGLRLDEILDIWADNDQLPREMLERAVDRLHELGYLVARQWVPQTHEMRWFLGAGLVVPHLSDGLCDVCTH